MPAELLAWSVDALALGRVAPAELLRYLMARAGEREDLRSYLGLAHERASKMREPHVELAGLTTGRRRLHIEAVRRRLRIELSQAIATGDSVRAADLQRQLLELMREDRPHKDRNDEPPPQKGGSPTREPTSEPPT